MSGLLGLNGGQAAVALIAVACAWVVVTVGSGAGIGRQSDAACAHDLEQRIRDLCGVGR